jgi:hypothetical protein
LGGFERPAEIVHGEHVFQKLRFLEVADAAGLARRIQLVRHRIGTGIEVMIVARLVDAHAPQNDRGVIPVAPDHAAHVVHRDVLPGFVANVLPARNFLEHQQPNFIAGIQKMPRLRIVRGAHNVAVEFLRRICASRRCTRPGIACPTQGKRLVPIQSAQLDHLAVERETLRREARLAEADAARVVVEQRRTAQQRTSTR